MKAEIRYLRVAHMFGRSLMYGQLYQLSGEKMVEDSTLASILQYAYDEQIEIVNAHDVLDEVVRVHGFAS